jgi:predicted HNH restriction endonuclease
MKKRKVWGTMSDEIQIEEILAEANAYSLKAEVISAATNFIKDDPDLDKVAAYSMAYIELIRNFES